MPLTYLGTPATSSNSGFPLLLGTGATNTLTRSTGNTLEVGTVVIPAGNLGTGGATGVTTPGALTAEGFLLALLQKAYASQSTDASRALEITFSTPFITNRGGDNVQAERYTVTIYQTGVGNLDPDNIKP